MPRPPGGKEPDDLVTLEQALEEIHGSEVEDGGYPPDLSDSEEALMEKLDHVGAPTKRHRARQIVRAEKMRRAVELRKAGATYRQISEQLGYSSEKTAHKLVKDAIKVTLNEKTDELRTLQYERLNHMMLVLWPKVQSGDERAITTALGIMDKMDRLYGVEAPQRIDVDHGVANAVFVVDGDKDNYIAQLRKMAGEIAPEEAKALLQPSTPDEILDAEIIEEDE